jgi:hypothetical protein
LVDDDEELATELTTTVLALEELDTASEDWVDCVDCVDWLETPDWAGVLEAELLTMAGPPALGLVIA